MSKVSLVVSVYNEESVIKQFYEELLSVINNINGYLFEIIFVDDGSTDDSLKTLQFFKENPQVKIHHKENGGKYTALNFGIENSQADLFGCLDADSFVDKDALKNMMPYFENPKIMAVVPSIKVYTPTNMLQKMQKIEYGWGIFVRKVLTYLNALHVTPGPFTIFRRKIFENIGQYKHAHQSEDLEMALRMQKHNYKIANSHRSYVFTVTPNTLKTLYKQRLRWAYGFLKNIADYKHLFFKKKYGNVGFLILPFATISIFSALYFTINFMVSNINIIIKQIVKIKIVGISFSHINFDWFYINISLISIITVVILLVTVTLILISGRLSEGKLKIKPELFYFIFLYPIIAPLWLGGAVFNIIFSKTMTWR